MKQFSLRDHDYPFGQAMLTLRTVMGLSQAGLAEFLGVSRRAVGAWELGNKYPRAEHLKQFITLAVQQKAFPAEHEADEIRALWQLARQKVLLDERWLANLLAVSGLATVNIGAMVEQTTSTPSKIAPAQATLQTDWGDALTIPSFYGRVWELNLLTEWVVKERCRVVSILGLGGIGKSALAVSLMQHVAEQFEVVIWRSLRDLPSVETLLDDLLQFLAAQATGEIPSSLDQRLSLLLEYMRSTRVLLILDNLESVIDEGKNSGRMRVGYEALERFLRQSAETNHRSCLLITSREKPNILVAQEGNRSPVRALRLARLDLTACEALLADKDVKGTDEERARLIEIYTGNPLALKIVAQTIFDLFDGAIAPFLTQGEVIFGGVRELLTDQFARLSILEQRVLLWLSILGEPSSLDELLAVLVTPVPGSQLLEAVDRLHRRSLVEHGQKPGSFALQSVVLEYLTAQLIVESFAELQQGKLSHLIEYGLVQAHARDYVRKSQERLLIEPLLALMSQNSMEMEYQIIPVLNEMRALPYHAQGYAPANLLALLRLHRGHLRGLDLSHLALRSVYLQGVEMQDTTFSKALMQHNVFTQFFSAVLAVDVSKSGDYWAASTSRGDVMLWTAKGLTLHRAWRAHGDMIWALKFSPNGRFLATGSWDGAVKVWDIIADRLLWSGSHLVPVNCVVFSPDGRFLASGGNDATVALWDVESGRQLQTLSHPVAVTGCALDWSPDGKFLISGDREGTIRLWELSEIGATQCVQTLFGHSTFVDVLAFSPDGYMLASASFDGTVKVWEIVSSQLHLRQTLVGHLERIGRVAWSPDGRTLACGGMDTMVWLYDVEEGSYHAALRGHTSGVTGLAFMPDGSSLLSGGDYSLRLWDSSNGRCTRVLEGYSNFLYTVDWSPDGQRLVSGGMDMLVTLWDLSDTVPSR